MKAFIIAAVSADGYIAKDANHPAFWTSKEDKKRFVELTKRAGVVIMGANTYVSMPRALKERTNIVYSRSKTFPDAETTQDSPAELLQKLSDRGFTEAAVCGGTSIYDMFMKARVIDRLYLTVEPIVFGKGLRIFDQDMLFHLELIDSSHTESGSMLLTYKVDYSGTPKP